MSKFAELLAIAMRQHQETNALDSHDKDVIRYAYETGARDALMLAAQNMRPRANEGHNAGSQRLKCVDELIQYFKDLGGQQI